jgi:hypothetical protein
MIRDFALEETRPDWLNLLIESIRTWFLKWKVKKLEENFFLIH